MKWFTHPPEVYWRAFYRRRHHRLHNIPAEEQTCLNCGTKYHGNYCPVCGQSHRVKSLTFLHLLRNFWFSLITLRKGYAITLIELTGHPGYFIRHYIRGHRTPYVHPFRLLLVLLVLYVLLSLTFMPEQVTEEHSFGFTSYLKTIQTGDWRQTCAEFLITVLQYIHQTPLLQMAATRFESWFFQNPALQALTLFPFFTIFSYTLFHSGITHKSVSKVNAEKESEKEEHSPGIFETTIKEPLQPLWDILGVARVRIKEWMHVINVKFAVWWIKNFGRPTPLIKLLNALTRLIHKVRELLCKSIKKIRPKKANVYPITYNFIEIIYMRGYFTCLLMEVNLVLFFWGVSVTPYNIWVIAGTVWIYKNFFRWRWWDAIRRTWWMYVLTIILTGLYCMITSIIDVVKG